jgi:hypothetical protein
VKTVLRIADAIGDFTAWNLPLCEQAYSTVCDLPASLQRLGDLANWGFGAVFSFQRRIALMVTSAKSSYCFKTGHSLGEEGQNTGLGKDGERVFECINEALF